MPNQDEQITDQQVTSNEQEATPTPESSTQGQSENVGDAIPEKFAGKSATEIAQAYKELEKDRGRLATDLGSARKEREDMETRFKLLEQAVARANYGAPQVQAQETALPDPFEVLDKNFDDDPKKAIREALAAHVAATNTRLSQTTQARVQDEAAQYYHSQKQANPDYARREPLMMELQRQFADIIAPEHRNSKKALEALDLMSRGKDVDYYTKQALSNAQKNGSSVLDEKRRAQSESSSSGGDQRLDYSKMSSKEIAKNLKRSDE